MELRVDEQLAKMASHMEQLLGMALYHAQLCNLPKLANDTISSQDFVRSLLQTLEGMWKNYEKKGNALLTVQKYYET